MLTRVQVRVFEDQFYFKDPLKEILRKKDEMRLISSELEERGDKGKTMFVTLS